MRGGDDFVDITHAKQKYEQIRKACACPNYNGVNHNVGSRAGWAGDF